MLSGALRGHLLGSCRYTRRYCDIQRRSASVKPLRVVSTPNLELLPAEPATVKPYDYHMFVELPAPESSGDSNSSEAQASPWWPSVVEKEPALLRVFSRLAMKKNQIDGVVKLTAFQEVRPNRSHNKLSKGANVFLYPDGVRYDNIPFDQLPDLVDRHFVTPAEGDAAPADRQDSVEGNQLTGIQLFVCCHGTRDARCGRIGVPLARRLETVAREAGMEDHVSVYMCSHIGGHKYAGNVLVMGAITPCDGDWYGGLRADDAETFVNALTNVEFGDDGGPADVTLRKWWRGRMGLDKAEQMEFFECGCLPSAETEDDEEGSAALPL